MTVTVRLLLSAGLVLLAGCGGDDVPSGAVAPEAQLTVTVDLGTGETREATLTCDGEAVGTGFLADRAAEACALVTQEGEARQLVAEGIPADAICTQVYGGPETAVVSGTLSGERIRSQFHRTNGCGINAWDLLEPLFGPPGN